MTHVIVLNMPLDRTRNLKASGAIYVDRAGPSLEPWVDQTACVLYIQPLFP
jgi:hypothetical protein